MRQWIFLGMLRKASCFASEALAISPVHWQLVYHLVVPLSSRMLPLAIITASFLGFNRRTGTVPHSGLTTARVTRAALRHCLSGSSIQYPGGVAAGTVPTVSISLHGGICNSWLRTTTCSDTGSDWSFPSLIATPRSRKCSVLLSYLISIVHCSV